MRSLSTAARSAAPLLLALALAACQDPTGVGLGLIDDETSQPRAESIYASSVDLQAAETTTAGFAQSGSQTRVLIGSVVDPIYGDATATAYLDANLPTAGRPTNFQDSTITAVALQLRLDDYITVDSDTLFYVYGDPSASLPIEVREVTSSWAPTDLAPDAVLPTGNVIATGTISPTDTTFTLNLDATWVTANADKIRSAEFVTEFEGFEVRIPEGTNAGAIRGFDATVSNVLVATAADTLFFPVNEVLTSIVQGDAEASADVIALRAGRPQSLSLDFDFSPLGAAALARAETRLPIERSQTGGTTFIRPLARQALLVALNSDETRTQLDVFTLSADGDARTIGGSAFTGVIQEALIGARTFTRYEVTLQSNPVSLDVLPVIIAPADTTRAPRFTLTLVGQPVEPS